MGDGDTLRTFRAELHVHTVLSPCAEVEMIPPLIVREAVERGINLIAITDHNASANVGAVIKAAKGTELAVLPGMELQTREEVHSLCLFDRLEQLEDFQTWVNTGLPDIQNRPDFFGEQFVVDETGEFIRREEQLLLVSVEYSMSEAFQKVCQLGGLFIPAHVDRTQFGLISVLGLVPDDISLELLEISRRRSPDQARVQFPQISRYPLIQSGDVHRLDEFLGANEFMLDNASIDELRLAIHLLDGRRLAIRA